MVPLNNWTGGDIDLAASRQHYTPLVRGENMYFFFN